MDDIVWIREDVPPKKNEDIGSRVGVEECNKGNNVKNESKKTSGAEFDINDYERTLESNVQEAINLVSDLCDRSSKVQKNQEDLLQSLEKERKERQKVEEEMRHVLLQNKRLEEEKHRLESEVSCLKFRLNGGANLEPEEAEVILNDGCIEVGGAGRMSGSERLLEEPNGAVLLPNMTLIVSDQKKGIFHLSLTSNLLRNISNSNWKWIQAPAVTKGDHPEIMVSVIAKEDGSSKWERFIFKFNENLQFIAKVKGPKWVAEYSVTRDRISIAADGYIYLMVTNTTFTALYQLSPDCKWTELCHRKDVCFLDLQVLATVGPITQLMVVEQRHGYVWVLSVRESQICARRIVAPVQRASSIAVDERGNMFIHDLQSASVRLLDSNFNIIREVCLVSALCPMISARKGFLLVTDTRDNVIRAYKYKVP